MHPMFARILNSRLAIAGLVAGASMLGGCGIRLDMHDQPKYIPLRMNTFYADNRSARPIIEGTVARGQERADEAFYTGKTNGQYVTDFPIPVTQQLMERGRERFNVYCSPCHSRLGDGNGMIVQRGFRRPPNFHDQKIRQQPVGHYFDVISNGFGSMGDYSAQVQVRDRWAIAAYIRALQYSTAATRADVPAGTEISTEAPQINVNNQEPMSKPKGTHGEAGAADTGKNPE